MAMLAWLERTRRSAPWRCWVRGTQVFLGGAAVIGVAAGLAALGVARVLVDALAVAGFGAGFGGCGTALVGVIVLTRGDREMFNAHRGAVSAALARDLLRWRAPRPSREPAWPPPQWRRAGERAAEERIVVDE
jgi:hypothetical protein